jgi:DNA-binding response OmpR family regulator
MGYAKMESTTGLVGRSVLVVEDEPLIALELKELFEHGGARVHVAFTPIDALRLVEETSLSVAVLDFGSRGDDNAPLCRTLHALGIPFMYYSGFDDLDDELLGAPIVTKPARAETLITAITQLVSPTIEDTDQSPPDVVAF